MPNIGVILIVLGGVVLLIGHIWLVVEAFRANALWGLAVMLMPIASLAFLFRQRERALNPFVTEVIGLLLMLLGGLLGGTPRG